MGDGVELRRVLRQAVALRDAMREMYRKGGESSFRFASYKHMATSYNGIAEQAAPLLKNRSGLFLFSLDTMPGSMDATVIMYEELFDSVFSRLHILIATIEGELGIEESRVGDLRNFLDARLRSAIRERPENEVAVQDALEALLLGRGLEKGVDYDRETGRVKVSTKESIPDFILPNLSLAIEVKLVTSAARRSAVVDEINADIRAYSKAYENILFTAYDLGFIQNVFEFRKDLDSEPGVSVLVVKH